MKKLLLITIGLLFMLYIGCNEKKEPAVSVIFDTDMGPDYDDVGALTLLHAMADSGEVKILATVSSNIYSNSVPCIDIINHYFGRPEIPLGAPRKGVNIIEQRFIGRDDYWAENIPKRYPHKTKRAEDAPDGNHERLIWKIPKEEITRIIEDMMMHQPVYLSKNR